jgi:hypothetical protein
MIKAKPTPPLLEALGKATSGLLFPSESDYPLTPTTFPGETGAEPTPATLLAAAHLPADTLVETITVADLFDPFAKAADDASAEDKAEAARYRAIVELLDHELTDLRVYRVGRIDIDVYVLGKDPSGAWLGLKTHVVET